MRSQLLLLSEGHVMFYGAASCADAWFDLLGKPLPPKVNVADHIIDLACVTSPDTSATDAEESVKRLLAAFASREVGELWQRFGGEVTHLGSSDHTSAHPWVSGLACL
jgi:hypothetical protein